MFDLDAMFEAPRKRPAGIKLIAVLVCIQGVFRLLAALFFLLGALLGGWALTTSSVIAGIIAALLLAILGLATLFLAWGLWTLKRWAYWGTVALMALDLLGDLFEFTLPFASIWTILGPVIPAAVLIYFLVASDVRRAFMA
jgi:hypothetical protein